MDVHDPEPDVRPSQIDRYEFHPSSTSSHRLRLSIAIIVTILHVTPIIIRNPRNPTAIIFAQPYITKWLMVPYAVYHMRTSKSSLISQHGNGRLDRKVHSMSATSDDLLITEPHTIMRNLRVGRLTYGLCGGVLVWDAFYLWRTYILHRMWNSLPSYAVGQWSLELSYLIVAVVLLVTFILGPLSVLVVVCGYGQELWTDENTIKRLCMETIELEDRERKGKKEP